MKETHNYNEFCEFGSGGRKKKQFLRLYMTDRYLKKTIRFKPKEMIAETINNTILQNKKNLFERFPQSF